MHYFKMHLPAYCGIINGLICAAGSLSLPFLFGLTSTQQIIAYSIATLSFGFVAFSLWMLNRSSSLRRTLRSIVEQVEQSSHSDSDPVRSLKHIHAQTDTAEKWNSLVDRMQLLTSLDELESRISAKTVTATSISTESILDGLGEGVAVTDVDDRLVIINDALTSLLKSFDDPEEIQGQPFGQLIQSLPGAEDLDSLQVSSNTRKPVGVEITSEEEEQLVLRVNRRPQLDDLNQVRGFVWTVRDVTQTKKAEVTREQFVGMATHELRAPLANIRAYAEALSLTEGIDITKQKEFCNTIQSEATRLGRFVDDLLDVTRMQAGSLVLNRRETDLEKLFVEAKQKLAEHANQKEQTLEASLPAKFPNATIDKEKILAAVVNLLGNAVKYTPEQGQIQLKVSAGDGQLTVVVEDNGIGISDEDLPRVFEKFFRSDDSRTREVSGSGIGLAFSREVARLHGGDIQVTSEIDKGSRFTMTIPLQ